MTENDKYFLSIRGVGVNLPIGWGGKFIIILKKKVEYLI